MKLTAILTESGFAGVVPSHEAASICAAEGLTEYTAIDGVEVANTAPHGSTVIYRAEFDELIDDLQGSKGKVVFKA